MIKIEHIKQLLNKYSISYVNSKTNINPDTLYKIRSGANDNPLLDTFLKLNNFFTQEIKENQCLISSDNQD